MPDANGRTPRPPFLSTILYSRVRPTPAAPERLAFPDPMPDRLARFTAFATLGAMSTTQDVAGAVLRGLADAGADPELVIEETLCLVATATARAAEVGLRETPEVAQPASAALFDLPLTYRDYLVGGAVLTSGEEWLLDANRDVYARLERKRGFYAVHLPEGQFPGPRALADKMELWLGRVSPPGLPEPPQDRLPKLGAVETLTTHLKLVLGFARRGDTAA